MYSSSVQFRRLPRWQSCLVAPRLFVFRILQFSMVAMMDLMDDDVSDASPTRDL